MTTTIQLDWQAYFHKFMETHGEPVPSPDGNWLLFSDGWKYSNSDYQGPEYPPPQDSKELRKLKIQYHTILLEILDVERRKISNRINTLKHWQQAKSLPLQQRMRYQTEDGKYETNVSTLDLQGLQAELDDLRFLFRESTGQLETLRGSDNDE